MSDYGDRPRAADCGCEPWDSYDLHSGHCRYSEVIGEREQLKQQLTDLEFANDTIKLAYQQSEQRCAELEGVLKETAGGCACCGGKLVLIRDARALPERKQRTVCPTCLAERMDEIRRVSSPEYGVAYQNPEPLKALSPTSPKE